MAQTFNQDAAAVLDRLRPKSTRIGYRMVGFVADTQDIAETRVYDGSIPIATR